MAAKWVQLRVAVSAGSWAGMWVQWKSLRRVCRWGSRWAVRLVDVMAVRLVDLKAVLLVSELAGRWAVLMVDHWGGCWAAHWVDK